MSNNDESIDSPKRCNATTRSGLKKDAGSSQPSKCSEPSDFYDELRRQTTATAHFLEAEGYTKPEILAASRIVVKAIEAGQRRKVALYVNVQDDRLRYCVLAFLGALPKEGFSGGFVVPGPSTVN